MQYLVTMSPRRRYAGTLATVVVVVEAPSGAAAIRQAREAGRIGQEDWFGDSKDYSAPNARPLKLNNVYSF